ncbi:HU family DNA-binding protein [Pedobacter immunditicola]|uniref:HU domain-containing protein n=1 Tax=Pedobacter immunditicola TaxID=3133440 RepID=UPI0030A0F814
MDILSYLAEVIQNNKEVGVPELGTFFKKKSPGRYDAELHSFLPPSYQLAFSPEVTEDILLSEYISKQHNLSEESANYHIDQFVANLKERLAEDRELELKTLGKFTLTAGELQFHPNPKLNLGFKFYGLPDVAEEITEKEVVDLETPAVPVITSVPDVTTPAETEARAPDVEKEDINITDQEDKAPLNKQSFVKEEELEAIIAENNLEEENPGNLPDEPIYTHEPEFLTNTESNSRTGDEQVNYQIDETEERSTPTYLKVIIAILALLCITMALFLWNPVWFDNLINRNNGQLPVNPVTDSVSLNKGGSGLRDTLNEESKALPVGTDTLKKDSVQASRPVTATPATATTEPAPPAVLPKGTTFEIIGSSVYSEKEAERFIASMKRKWGINAKVVSKRPGKKIKISIATYKDEKTARAERARLEDKIKIPGLYIYTNTHKED